MSKINTNNPTILIIDDKKRFPDKLKLLSEYNFIHVGLGQTNIKTILGQIDDLDLDKDELGIILLDLEFKEAENTLNTSQENLTGLELITPVKERFSNVPIIITTVYGDLDIVKECLIAGADNFLRKSEFEELQWRKIFDIYIENKQLQAENKHLKNTLTQIHKYTTACVL